MKRRGQAMVPKSTVIQTQCDGCGRVVDGDPDDWVEIRTGHEDWGNDSIEANREFDACSPQCFVRVLEDAVEDYDADELTPTFYARVSDTLSYDFARGLVEMLTP
jgi:hypothetical protein